jgi:hypothetical protein
MTTARMITIELGYDSPPLRSNQRMHWAPKAALTREVRQHVAWQASDIRHRRGVILGPVTVTLVWTVTDRRRRDVGASSPTLKAAIDGLVDGGLLSDDRHEIVTAETCRIEHGTVAGVRIELEAA